MPKKSFKDGIAGADKLFSVNDAPETETTEADITQNTLEGIVSSNEISNISTNRYSDILDNIKRVEEPSGKTCAIYLSGEVLTAVNVAAKEKNVSRSKLIDRILKQVLLGEV